MAYWYYNMLLLIGTVLFSSKGIWIKLAYQYSISPLSLLLLRMLFSLPIYLIVGWLATRGEKTVPLSISEKIKIVLLGVSGYYLSSYLDFTGLQYVSVGLERVILYLYPSFVILISAVVYKRKVTAVQKIALIIIYSGIFICYYFKIGVTQNFQLGVFLIFCCTFTYAIFIVGSSEVIPKVGSVRFTAWVMSVSAICIIIHSIIAGEVEIFHYPQEVYSLAIIMAVFSTAIPTFLLSEGLRKVGATNGSLIAGIGPVSTVVMGYLILNETIGWNEFIGSALVIGGVVLISLKGKQPAKVEKTEEKNRRESANDLNEKPLAS